MMDLMEFVRSEGLSGHIETNVSYSWFASYCNGNFEKKNMVYGYFWMHRDTDVTAVEDSVTMHVEHDKVVVPC